MECNRFVEEKIAETGGLAFREHLAECAGCGRDVEELEEIRLLYNEASIERYSGAVPRTRGPSWDAWFLATTAAAAMIAALVAVLLAGPAPSPVPVKGVMASPAVRFQLQPWDSEEAEWNLDLDDLRRRLDGLERSW